MHGPDGQGYKNKIQFIEINKPHSIYMKHMGEGETGDTEDVPMQVRVSLEDSDGGTYLTMEQIFPEREELERVDREYGAIEGGKQHPGNPGKYLEILK